MRFDGVELRDELRVVDGLRERARARTLREAADEFRVDRHEDHVEAGIRAQKFVGEGKRNPEVPEGQYSICRCPSCLVSPRFRGSPIQDPVGQAGQRPEIVDLAPSFCADVQASRALAGRWRTHRIHAAIYL